MLLICFLLVTVVSGGIAGYWYYQHTTQVEPALQSVRDTAKEVDIRIAEIEAKKKEPVFITLPSAAPIRAIVEDYNSPSSLWTMVNKSRSLPIDYKPSSLTIPDVPTRTDKTNDERSIRSDITKNLEALFAAAKADGHELMIGSAYRSADLQAAYFNSYAASSGLAAANQYSAKPGQSEHQLGLAVDISTLSRQCYLSECFTTTPDGEWLATHAHEYGFHLRYIKGKEAITGYNFEPWHYRYIGVDLATALYESELTLEEAWPQLETALKTLKNNRAL
ncbi:MAG: D-alanyl-D-alanine carboxypeptidase family protein [Candidatus Microsaccharimonas sp.]